VGIPRYARDFGRRLPLRSRRLAPQIAFFLPLPYHRFLNELIRRNFMTAHILRRFAFLSVLMFSAGLIAQQAAPAPDTQKDTITRIFSGEFSDRPAPAPRWFD